MDAQINDYDEGKVHLLMTPKQPEYSLKTPESGLKFQTIKRQVTPGQQVIDDLHPTINLNELETKKIDHLTDPKSATSAVKQNMTKKIRSQSNHQNLAEIPCSKSQMDLFVRRESPKVKDCKENNRCGANSSRIKDKSKSRQTPMEFQENSEYQKARNHKNMLFGLLKANIMGRSPTPQTKAALIPPKEIMVGKQVQVPKIDLKQQLMMHFQNADKHLFQTQTQTENNGKKQRNQIKSIDPNSNPKMPRKVHIDLNRGHGSPSNQKDNITLKPLLAKTLKKEIVTNITSFCPESTDEFPRDEPKTRGNPAFLPFDESVFQLLKKYETTDFNIKKRKDQQRTKKRQVSKVKIQPNEIFCEQTKKQEDDCQNNSKTKNRQRTKSSLLKQIPDKPSTLGTKASFYNRVRQINLDEVQSIPGRPEMANTKEPQTARLVSQSFNEYGSATARHLTAQKPQLFNSMKKLDYAEERNGKASRSLNSKEDAFHNFLKKNNEHCEKKRLIAAHNFPFDRK